MTVSPTAIVATAAACRAVERKILVPQRRAGRVRADDAVVPGRECGRSVVLADVCAATVMSATVAGAKT